METTTGSRKIARHEYGPYRLIYADPSWRFSNWSMSEMAQYGEKWARRMGRSPYPVMNLDDMMAMPVKQLAARDSLLAMWCTGPMIADGAHRALADAWGFDLRALSFVWIKLNPSGIGLFFGQGYHCLGAQVKVYICHKITNIVEELTVSELATRPAEDYLIHSHQGWKQLKAAWQNVSRETVSIKHRLGETVCTPDHRWAVKYLSAPRKLEGGRNRVHKVVIDTITTIHEKSKLATYESGQASLNLIFSTRPVESPDPIRLHEGFCLDYNTGWLIGLYAAEGNLGNQGSRNQIRFTLHSDEEDLYQKLAGIVASWQMPGDRYFNSLVKVRRHKRKDVNSQVCYFASARAVNLIQQFIFGDSAPSKCLNLAAFLQTMSDFRQGFIDGILAGDGTKNNRPDRYGVGYRGFISIGLSSEQLISDLQDLLRAMGVMTVQDLPEDKVSPWTGRPCRLYHLRFVHPRNDNLELDGEHVLPVHYDGIRLGVVQPTYDVSVEDELFVADGLVSHNTHGNAEYVFIGRRGQGCRVIHRDVFQLVFWPRARHSAKPPVVRDRLLRLYGDVPRIELFARERAPGWSSWGNEVVIIPGSPEDQVLGDYLMPPYEVLVDEDEAEGLPVEETIQASYAPGEQMRLI